MVGTQEQGDSVLALREVQELFRHRIRRLGLKPYVMESP